MNKAKVGDTVRFHYTTKLDSGFIIESSYAMQPVETVIGESDLHKGVESILQEMSIGEKRIFNVPAKDAYGLVRDELIIKVSRADMAGDMDLHEEDLVRIQGEDGRTIEAIVVELTDDYVKIDSNHPFAGEDLTFELELLEVRATV